MNTRDTRTIATDERTAGAPLEHLPLGSGPDDHSSSGQESFGQESFGQGSSGWRSPGRETRPAPRGGHGLLGQLSIVAAWGVVAVLAGIGWSLLTHRGDWMAVAGEEIPVEVRTIAFDHESNAPVVVLQSTDQGKALPIWVGTFEAQAIAMEMEGIAGPRPLTHDLMKSLVEQLHGELERVVIEELREHTYYATIYLRAGGDEVRVDSRPSDAIALALRFRRPILVNGTLLTGEQAVPLPVEAASDAVTQMWGLTLQDVTEPLADLLALDGKRGVLVSDVSATAAVEGVRRGDVITALNGSEVRSVADLKSRVASLTTTDAIRLGVGRGGVPIEVQVATTEP